MSKQGSWTDEQWQAITARGSNLLVAAAAGAGKTAVLVERIIERVTAAEDPVDIDRLLVVTFTNAAAAEMRARITKRLMQAVNAAPCSRHLARQLTLINRAHITTLHSFCLELVRGHYYSLHLDPNFRIADETETALLRLEVLEELFENWYGKEDNANFLALVDCYGGERGDQLLQELVLRLDEFSQSQPHPKDWLNRAVGFFSLSAEQGFDDLLWVERLKNSIKLDLQKAESLLRRALKISRAPGGPAAYSPQIETELGMLSELLSTYNLSWATLGSAFQETKFSRLKSCRGDVDELLKKQASQLRKEAKDILESLTNSYFSRSQEELIQDLEMVAPQMATLSQMVLDFQTGYQQIKLERSLVDFNDLEHYALKLLLSQISIDQYMPSDIARELQEQFVEIMVDEYQDINMVQETILQLVSRQENTHPNLFMVGDMKQSIYRFRLAEPGLFLHKYNLYGSSKTTGARRIDLSKNFRSRQEIIEGTNFIFKQLMSSDFGEMAYDKGAELVYGANYPLEDEAEPRAIELCLIDHKETAEPGVEALEEQEELNRVQIEARLIGQKILRLVSYENGLSVFDKSTNTMRRADFRDIVILLRSTKGQANTYIEEFRQMGIPAYADVGSGYLTALEVDTFLAVLKVIDNPQQDIPLAAVLRSPIIGLTAEDLAQVRAVSPDGNFYHAVQCMAQENNPLGEKLQQFLHQLDRWRTQARRDTLANLIWAVYRETGYFDYVGGIPSGNQRQANLRALHDRASQYEKTSFRGLFHFLRFIERLQDSGSDLGMARALGENENLVRIMSIHKSKGLEFPIVFVGGLGKRFNMQDLNENLLLHKDLGFGPALVHSQSRLVYPTIAKLALKHQIKMETLAEELRVLYVAMTRAKEQLFLVGSVPDLAKQAEEWVALAGEEDWPLPAAALSKAKTYLDWICPAIARHQAGAELRKLGQWGGQLQEEVRWHPSAWKVCFFDKSIGNFISNTGEANQLLWDRVYNLQTVKVAGDYIDLIKGRLTWRYPFREATIIPAKLAVSEVKQRFAPRLLDRPKFLQEGKGLSGAEKGSALHLALQHLDFTRSYQRKDLEHLLEELVQREILTEEQFKVIDPIEIEDFLASALGKRLGQAKVVYQELPFSLMLEARDLFEELEACEEGILVQGVIDVLFEEEEGLVLLDYKTDYVEDDSGEELLDTYQGQLNLYAKAVEKILKQQVKEKILYSFSLQKALTV